MNTYQLSIITPGGKVFDGLVESLVAPGSEGFLGIWANHAPMAVALRPGPLTLKKDEETRYFAVSSGILEVDRQRNVLVLCDDAVESPSREAAKSKAAP